MYDLPHAYDIVFDIDTVKECDFLEAITARHGRSTGRRVLEPACGTGRMMRELAGRGWDTAGFDVDPGMLAFARELSSESDSPPHYAEGRFDGFTMPGRFDLAHCLISSIQHVSSEEEARRHLQLVADHLESGGLYVLGLHLVDRPDLLVDSETFHADRDGAGVTCILEGDQPDLPNRRQRIHADIHVEHPDGTRTRHRSSWWFRTWTLEQFLELLATEPRLELVALHDFGLDPCIEYALEDDLVDLVSVLRRT
jgi:SAM-dependent methyltransferase